MTFRGRVALVVGGGSGMGQLAAWRLAAGGAVVAAADVNEAGLARTTLRTSTIHRFACDVSDDGAVHDVVKQVEADLGPIDRVVNAAAILPNGPLLDQSLDEIRRATEINYLGLVSVTKATLPGMLERGHGDLIQFASLAGWLPSQRLGAYSATKAAVLSFCETLYHENRGRGVRMVCVCPPVVDTPLLDQVGERGPKSLSASPAIRPEVVLDAIESGLDDGRFLVFPGRGTSLIWRARRFVPQLVWNRIDRLEAD